MKDKKKKKTIKQIFEDSRAGAAKRSLNKMLEESRTLLYIIIIISFIVSLFIVGLLAGGLAITSKSIRHLSVGLVIGYGIRYFYITIIISVVIDYMVIRTLTKYRKDSHYDEKKKIEESEQNTLGSNRRMKDGPDKDEAYTSSNALENTANIYGRDLDHPDRILSLNKNLFGVNDNELVVGPPGSTKTRCHVIPNVMQMIRRGESIILTDTKASLYGKLKILAENRGYVTKYINFDSRSMSHSDTVNLFKPATKSDVMCSLYARTVVDNFGSKQEIGYWSDAAVNLLTATMLMVKNDTTIKEEDKTLTKVAKILNTNTKNDLIAKFNEKKIEGSQMTACANNWINSGNAIDSAFSGLAMKLTRLINPTIGKVIGRDELDMQLPGKQKCLYFINLSDMSRDMDFLSALFFFEIISELEELADRSPGKILPITTYLFFEEFANVGKIPDWHTMISTLRSRNIKSIMILQGLEQLDINYPEALANTIRNACSTQILLGTNSETTAKIYSDRSGEMTAVASGTAAQERATDPLKIHQEYRKTETVQKRNVYTIGEIYKIKYPYQLVFLQGFDVCEMERLDMSNHPMIQEIREIDATHHYPQWVHEIDPTEYEEYEINIKDFKTDEEMMIESGVNNMKPYICTESDFKNFYHEKKVHVINKYDEEEAKVIKKRYQIDKARDISGEDTIIDDIGSIDDLFK